VIDAERGLDAGLLEPQVARVEVVERPVLERAVMEPGVRLLFRVVGEAREGEQRDPVVRLVVAQPGADVIAEDHLGADEDRVVVDHLAQPGGLEVDVVEPRVDHGFGHLLLLDG
jgi:hypothetical protein